MMPILAFSPKIFHGFKGQHGQNEMLNFPTYSGLKLKRHLQLLHLMHKESDATH